MADWYFRNNQGGGSIKPCPGCRQLVSKNAEFCPYCAKRLRPEAGAHGLYRRLRSWLLGGADSITRILLGALVVMFLLQAVSDLLLPASLKVGGGESGDPFGMLFSLLTADPVVYIRMGSNFHAFVQKYHQYWRFLTSCFLHFGLFHIAMNGLALWDLGRIVERMWGKRQLFAVFILTGFAGGAASYAWRTLMSDPKNAAGASGAICGLLGLFLGAYYRNRHLVGEWLGAQLYRWAVYILVFGLVAGADNAAHIGGMLAGAVLGYLLPPTHGGRISLRDHRIWTGAAWVAAALLIVCLAFGVLFYMRNPADWLFVRR